MVVALLLGVIALQAPSADAAVPERYDIFSQQANDGGATLTVFDDCHDPSITGFDVSTDGGATFRPADVTPCDPGTSFRTITITGLQNGTTYTIEIRAVNADGPGPASGAVQVVPGLPETPALTVVPFDQGGGGTITFPEPNGYGSPIKDYQTSVTSDGTIDYRELPYSVADDGAGNRTVSITLTGLQNQTPYTITVRAQSGYGFSADASTSFSPDIKPNAPRNVRAFAPSDNNPDGRVQVSFDAPQDNGSSAIQFYIVTANSGGAQAFCYTLTDPCVVEGLTNGTAYTFSVVAVNSGTPSQNSDPATSDPTKPVVPYAAPLAPRLYASGIAYNSAVLSFTVNTNGRPATGYEMSVNGGAWRRFAPVFSGGRLVTRLSLAANTRYTFAVRVINVAGTGPSSNVVSILTNPPALGSPGVTTGTSWAMVSWRRSPNDGATLGYTVYAHPGPATCSTYYRGDTACLIGARAGTRYTYTVVARNRTGGAPQSRASRVVVTAAPRVPKKAPGVVHALSTGKVSKVKRGAKLKVAGAGFLPYSSVTVVAYGKQGHVTGRLVANGRGQIFATVQAPKDKIKKYTFVAFGVTQYGSSKAIGKTLRRR